VLSPELQKTGELVTIIAKPNSGYEVDKISVTDEKGKEVTVTQNADGTYSFTQPDSTVTLSALFKEKLSVTPVIPPTPSKDDDEKMPFTDVRDNDYFYNAVNWAYKNNITSGTTGTSFGPGEIITRGQMITFLWRINGSKKVDANLPFKDVKKTDYFNDAVCWAYKNKITSGTSVTTFSPNVYCKRAEMITFIWRIMGSEKMEGANPFTDVQKEDYFADAVNWAYKKGISAGTSKTTFSPKDDCKRCQAITFLYRMK
ncbi:S-layer homology domain-containing protein, partial [Bilifractor sp. LCP21S3_E12]